jgi:transcriptional regulator with GAF, ATPase, and Fis domain
MPVTNVTVRQNIRPGAEAKEHFLVAFTNAIATARDKATLKTVIKSFFRDQFAINEYIITVRNDDPSSYSYFLHDLPGKAPVDQGFRIITGTNMPVRGSMTGVVLESETPVTFRLSEVATVHKLSFPSESFWRAAGAQDIVGIRLRLGTEDVGILWIQNGYANQRLLTTLCAQLAIAISNILAHEKVTEQLKLINTYKQRLQEENLYLQEEIDCRHNSGEIVGAGSEMQKIFTLMNQVAPATSTVLILGETGTGKELIARAIHNASPRKDKIMVKVNCAALPENLIESELFGHEKGSFTGAIDRRIGKFELADNSTLFLDEIGEMPPILQAKLLRAIQEREIERVGGKSPIKINVRIVAASNRDLRQEVEAGRFRSDLFYRLNVFPITVPPLRERKEDIPMLANHFIRRFARSIGKKVTGISARALAELQAYSWPGNIRELEHTLERSMILSTGTTLKDIHLHALKLENLQPGQQQTCGAEQPIKTLRENERDHILKTLIRLKGKISGHGGAAHLLDVPPSTLNSKIAKLGITKEQILKIV